MLAPYSGFSSHQNHELNNPLFLRKDAASSINYSSSKQTKIISMQHWKQKLKKMGMKAVEIVICFQIAILLSSFSIKRLNLAG
jgi:hypothetical protein